MVLYNDYKTQNHGTCSRRFINSGDGFHLRSVSHLNFLFHIDLMGGVQFVGFCQ